MRKPSKKTCWTNSSLLIITVMAAIGTTTVLLYYCTSVLVSTYSNHHMMFPALLRTVMARLLLLVLLVRLLLLVGLSQHSKKCQVLFDGRVAHEQHRLPRAGCPVYHSRQPLIPLLFGKFGRPYTACHGRHRNVLPGVAQGKRHWA